MLDIFSAAYFSINISTVVAVDLFVLGSALRLVNYDSWLWPGQANYLVFRCWQNKTKIKPYQTKQNGEGKKE